MKRLFAFLAICAAFAASACLYETETADVSLCALGIPYISAINGSHLPDRVIEPIGSGAVSIKNPRGGASANVPVTVQIDVAWGGGGSTGGNMTRIGFVVLAFRNASVAIPANSGVTMKLYYSTDGGTTWVLAQQRKFADASVKTIKGLPFGRDSIPVTLSTGSTLKLRLVSFPTAYPESENFANSGNYYFYPSEWVGVSQSEVLKLLCSCHEVTITITGPRRGGR